jgi:hypothetical protein
VISGFRRKADENCALLGCLPSEQWQFHTEVSGQPIGTIVRGQVCSSCLTVFALPPDLNILKDLIIGNL